MNIADKHIELEAFFAKQHRQRGGLWQACVLYCSEHLKVGPQSPLVQKVYAYSRQKFPNLVRELRGNKKTIWTPEVLREFENHMLQGGEQADFCKAHNLSKYAASRYGKDLGYAQRMVTDKEWSALLAQRKTGKADVAEDSKYVEQAPTRKKTRSFKSLVVCAEKFAQKNWPYDPKIHESAKDYNVGFGVLVSFCLQILEEDAAE